jgi:hypothetical protein
MGTVLLVLYASALGIVGTALGRCYQGDPDGYRADYEWFGVVAVGTGLVGLVGLLAEVGIWLGRIWP